MIQLSLDGMNNMNKVKLTIAGGAIALIAIIGSLGIGKDDVAIEETPAGIFVNMSAADFATLRNGLAQQCIDETLFCEGCDNLAKISMIHAIFKQQVENDGGKMTLNNFRGDSFKEICKYLIR